MFFFTKPNISLSSYFCDRTFFDWLDDRSTIFNYTWLHLLALGCTMYIPISLLRTQFSQFPVYCICFVQSQLSVTGQLYLVWCTGSRSCCGIVALWATSSTLSSTQCTSTAPPSSASTLGGLFWWQQKWCWQCFTSGWQLCKTAGQQQAAEQGKENPERLQVIIIISCAFCHLSLSFLTSFREAPQEIKYGIIWKFFPCLLKKMGDFSMFLGRF